MNTSVNKILKVIALIIIAFLLIDTVSKIDTDSAKNDYALFKKKSEIDQSVDLTEVKYKAKDALDVTRHNQEKDSSAAVINMNLLIILACIQVYLSYYNVSKNESGS